MHFLNTLRSGMLKPCPSLDEAESSMSAPAHRSPCYWQAPRSADPFGSGQAAAAADDHDEDEDDSGGSSGFTKKQLRQRCPS